MALVCRMLIGRLSIGSSGGGGHEQVLVSPRGTAFLEYGDGARTIAGCPERFRDVAIDHAGGTCPDRGVRDAQRPFGLDEAAFSGSPVAVEDLVRRQRAVSQRKRPALESVALASIYRRTARPLSLPGSPPSSGRRHRTLAGRPSGRKSLLEQAASSAAHAAIATTPFRRFPGRMHFGVQRFPFPCRLSARWPI